MTVDDPSEKIAHRNRGAHVDVRVDVAGQVQFTNVDPATTTGSVQVTNGGSTTVVFTSQTLTSPSLALATLMSVSGTTSGTPNNSDIRVRRNASTIANTTGSGATSTSNRITAVSPTLDVQVTLSATGTNTATINIQSVTFSREQRW